MEIFQLKLKEAEKTAFMKEDCRRERWRKPTYSDRAQSSQEGRKSDLMKYNKNSKDRYDTTDTTNNIKDKFSDNEKDNRSGLETCRKESNPRQKYRHCNWKPTKSLKLISMWHNFKKKLLAATNT